MQLNGTEPTEWYDLLGKFKEKADEFSGIYDRLLKSGELIKGNPELTRERAQLLARAEKVKATVDTLTKTVDTAYSFLKNSMGLGNYSNESGNGALGALPLIPVAVAAASIAAMTKIIADALLYLNKAQRFEELSKQHGPDTALKIIKGLDPRSTFAGDLVKSLGPFILIAGGVWFFRDRIFK